MVKLKLVAAELELLMMSGRPRFPGQPKRIEEAGLIGAATR